MGSISMPMESSMSDSSASTPEPSIHPNDLSHHSNGPSQNGKRSASDAGLKANGARPAKSVKRRASKACQCCRARKVRCNVVEHGAPCTNCRLDEVECIVSESKRKKKWTNASDLPPQMAKPALPPFKPVDGFAMSAAPPYEPLRRHSEHVPHTLYQDLGNDLNLVNGDPRASIYAPSVLMNLQRMSQLQGSMAEQASQAAKRMVSPSTPGCSLPAYIKPMPSRLASDEIAFLERKGALSIPPSSLRDELLRSYAEYVHPYMPLLNLQELAKGIDRNDGSYQISLLVFQAVMFVAVATADMHYLKQAGYSSRRDARRDFFQKTRILYDFDTEVDRISLIQALLLMTYWYETPDDLKDSHHWMGIAVSLAHSIGLHRNPEKSPNMEPLRQRLWKRIWWATYMRDRLIALGMRRPTRINNSDFDVPMLTLDDFDIEQLPSIGTGSCIPARCKVMRDVEVQRQLAVMCIEKAKLCIAMSHVLSVQYSVLHNNHGVLSEEGSTRTTMMLVTKKLEPQVDEVQSCDEELQRWKAALAPEAQYVVPSWQDVEVGNDSVVLSRALLHMMYYATLSALHRPQVLPSSSMPPRASQSELIDISRRSVRLAAMEITNIANTLDKLGMVRHLPTTGVTVLLPAIIIHLLDIKAPDESTRRASLKGFCECMQIMAKLRDIYAAADYSTAFLEAAIRKAEIVLPQKTNEVKDSRNVITSTQGLVEAGRRMQLVGASPSGTLTPPPDDSGMNMNNNNANGTADNSNGMIRRFSAAATGDPHLAQEHLLARKINSYLASTPPESSSDNDMHSSGSDHGGAGFSSSTSRGLHNHSGGGGASMLDLSMPPPASSHPQLHQQPEYEPDFESLIDLDAAGEVWPLEDSAYAAMQGESSGFTLDVDWLKGIRGEDGLVGMSGGGAGSSGNGNGATAGDRDGFAAAMAV